MQKRGYRKSPKSADVRKKISLALKKYYNNYPSPWKNRHFSLKERKELSRLKNEFLKKNPAWRIKKSNAMKKYCKKHLGFMRKAQKISISYMRRHPEILMRRRKSIIQVYKNPELRKKMSRIINAKYKANPEIARMIDRKITLWWREHPNIRKERSRELREFFIGHPEEFKKKFMNGKNNPFSPHIKTRQGFKVRSAGEKKIADFLFENRIECSYETRVLVLGGWVCVPDFYLIDYNVYIEFYGGFPGSWKKKVLKNKLYKKHKIPCIFIIPNELKDLRGEIIGYLKRKFGEGGFRKKVDAFI
jgi:hypothetical protein